MDHLACVAGAWKEWAKERTGAREGDTRGVSTSRAPVFPRAHYFQAPAMHAMDHYTFLENCPPTPPLSQHFALSEK